MKVVYIPIKVKPDLAERLHKYAPPGVGKKGQRSKWIVEAIKEKLEREEKSNATPA